MAWGLIGFDGLAAELRASLAAQPGFPSVERFESFTQPVRHLAERLGRRGGQKDWRAQGKHRAAQHEDRNQVFSGYRLGVA